MSNPTESTPPTPAPPASSPPTTNELVRERQTVSTGDARIEVIDVRLTPKAKAGLKIGHVSLRGAK